MTLSDLASIGSLLSSIAVLVSLVYLSLQLKQADRNQQAAIRLGRSTRFVEIGIACTEPSLADAIAKGMAGWRAVWKRRRVIFVGDFLLFMDRLAAETALVPVTDSLAQWNADIAAEKMQSK